MPQLGPPLPEDLGKPLLNAGAVPPGTPQPLLPSNAPDPEAQRLAQERARLAQELEAARINRLFASEARAAVQPASVSTGATPVVPTPFLDQSALGPNAGGTSQPSEADRKLAFLNGPVDRRTTSSDRVQAPASRNVVQAGSVIAAAMTTGLRSDLPGQITAQVTEAVYDSRTGKALLIPQGAPSPTKAATPVFRAVAISWARSRGRLHRGRRAAAAARHLGRHARSLL